MENKNLFVHKCEFYESVDGHGVKYAEGLQDSIESCMHFEGNFTTNLQRKYCHKDHIVEECGRRQIHKFILDLIRTFFPLEKGTYQVGYHQNYINGISKLSTLD